MLFLVIKSSLQHANFSKKNCSAIFNFKFNFTVLIHKRDDLVTEHKKQSIKTSIKNANPQFNLSEMHKFSPVNKIIFISQETVNG